MFTSALSLVLVAITIVYQQVDGQTAVLSANNNAFATKLYTALKTDGKNLVCSPLSLSIVLSMLLEGSGQGSKTYSEIQNALQYSGSSLTDIENDYTQLLKSIQSGQGYTLNLADSIWIKKSFTVMPNYKKKVMDVFMAEINTLDQNDGASQINKWVASHTMNKITKLFDQLDPSVVMVLVNAIFFQAAWVKPFQTAQSRKGNFISNDNSNSKTSVTFMQQKDSFDYTDSSSLNAQVLLLDYQGRNVSMVVILPKTGNTLANLEANLDSEQIDNAIKQAESKSVDVTLPKFTITSSFDLNAPLQNMGINDAFGNNADFSNIVAGTGIIQVTKVVQKAIIEVTENGTVAAAATGAVISLTSAFLGDPVTFNANHPFIYILYHKPTASIIFIGRYTDPSAN